MAQAVPLVTARRLGVALAVVIGALLLPSPSAQASGVFDGACTMELQVTPTKTIRTPPALMSLTLRGGGTCATTSGVAPMEFLATVTTHPTFGGFGCGGGVAAGTGYIRIPIGGFSSLVLEVTIAAVGGAVTLVATADLTRFDGIAPLTQDPVDTAACPVSGTTATTWTGILAFQDPEPVAVG